MDIPVATPVPEDAPPPGTKIRWVDPQKVGKTRRQVEAEERQGPPWSRPEAERQRPPRPQRAQYAQWEPSRPDRAPITRDNNSWPVIACMLLGLVGLVVSGVSSFTNADNRPCTLEGLGWERTSGVQVKRKRQASGFHVPSGAFDTKYTGEKVSGHETVVVGSRRVCDDVPAYRSETYTERVCKQVYDYTEANADGSGKRDVYKTQCDSELRTRQVRDGYRSECRTVEDTEQRPIYRRHYTWHEWVWEKEPDVTQTGDHLTTPTWPQGWNDYGGYETRYTHKSSAYWAKVRDWNQARNPGLSVVNLVDSPGTYSDALRQVGEPVYVRRYYWSGRISEITSIDTGSKWKTDSRKSEETDTGSNWKTNSRKSKENDSFWDIRTWKLSQSIGFGLLAFLFFYIASFIESAPVAKEDEGPPSTAKSTEKAKGTEKAQHTGKTSKNMAMSKRKKRSAKKKAA